MTFHKVLPEQWEILISSTSMGTINILLFCSVLKCKYTTEYVQKCKMEVSAELGSF